MNPLRVALAGVGSCASSFVQLVAAARTASAPPSGVMYESIGGYRLGDVSFVLALDVDRNKLGLDLRDAIAMPPTSAGLHVAVPRQGVVVEAGPLGEGLDGYLSGIISPAPEASKTTVDDVTRRLIESAADVMVCLLPTGSTVAVQTYARAAAAAGVAFINATPEPVANEPALVQLFVEGCTPLLGDDLRSHFGATTLHTALIELLHSRALTISDTYQLNVGGNMDFLNLSDPTRSASKVQSKRNALRAAGLDADRIAAGPNGYIESLGDRKTCFLRIEARSVLDTPVVLDVRLEVEDSPNAAGVLANAVRVAMLAKDRKEAGVVDAVCPLLFKSPRFGAPESEGLAGFRDYLSGPMTSDNAAPDGVREPTPIGSMGSLGVQPLPDRRRAGW